MDKITMITLFVCLMAVVVTSGPAHEELRRRRAAVGNDAVVIVDAQNDRQSPFFFNPFAPRDQDEADDSESEDPFAWARPSFSRFPGSDFGQDFWSRLKNMMTNMQEELDDLYKRLGGEADPEFGVLPPNYHNSTSTTKVVNGSIITVNETVNKQTDNNTSSFFSFKVVHVKPEKPEEPEDTELASTVKIEESTNPAVTEKKEPAESLDKDNQIPIKPEETNEP